MPAHVHILCTIAPWELSSHQPSQDAPSHALQPIHVTGENGAVSTHCLLQVIRGQEVHVVRGDTSKAARLYRGKSNSLRTEGAADGEIMSATGWQVGCLVLC